MNESTNGLNKQINVRCGDGTYPVV